MISWSGSFLVFLCPEIEDRGVQYSQRGSRITPRPCGGIIILPALPRRGDSSRGIAGRSAVEYLLGKLPVQ